MNTKRREIIERSLSLLRKAFDDLEMVRDEEEEAYDNMPEGLQESERGEMMQEAIDTLDDAMSPLESAIDDLEEVYNDAEDEDAADYNPYGNLRPGDTVTHKSMGIGFVKSIDGKYIVIEFPDREMKFLFPDAFEKGFLTLK